eukprot:1208842-Rhodomonas_salina.1
MEWTWAGETEALAHPGAQLAHDPPSQPLDWTPLSRPHHPDAGWTPSWHPWSRCDPTSTAW